ncbi:hypothetical protein E2562_030500 [Oryza meyeriana var. granulata]|uniref:Uncharacterized protein n=1 Tax=Oryza meyeriana var. granulata TaxID=110450 RepID=A0A6G1CV83_9ORYZ|nr:hypothetical protein E2562_030500 [Oryza meyeriana var. granulata]
MTVNASPTSAFTRVAARASLSASAPATALAATSATAPRTGRYTTRRPGVFTNHHTGRGTGGDCPGNPDLPVPSQDFGGSFHGRHHHYRLRDGDKFYHYSGHRFVYTCASTGLRLGTAQDGAGQHSRLPEDRCTTGVGIDSEGDLVDPARYCTTYYLYHGSRDYSCVHIFTDIDHLWPCGTLLSEPGHHGSAR